MKEGIGQGLNFERIMLEEKVCIQEYQKISHIKISTNKIKKIKYILIPFII